MINTARRLYTVLMLSILMVMCGCGGGSSTNDTSATVSIVPAGSGKFIVQGDNMDGVSAIDLTISYDSTTLASPSVQKGTLLGDALFVCNPTFRGTIKIATVTNGTFAGSGQIASISFANVTGTGNVTIASFKLISSTGSTMGTGGTTPPAVTPGVPSSIGQPAATGTAQ